MLPGYVKVKATAKGFYIGPRSAGDVFDMPLNKDGSEPHSKWFTVIKSAVKKSDVKKPEGQEPVGEDGAALV